MTIFKGALRVALRHPVYLLVYAVWLSLLGLLIASSLSVANADEGFESYTADIAIVDRDGSELSNGLAAYLGERCTIVPVDDDGFALQDIVATGAADCLFVIPEGFGEGYLDAARNDGLGTGAGEAGGAGDGTDGAPLIEAAYGYQAMSGALANEDANRFLELVAAAAALDPEAPTAALVEQANDAAGEKAGLETVVAADASVPADRFAFYLQWSTYTLTAAIVVCVGVLMGSFNRTDLRRRNLSSPVGTLSLGLQLGLGCLFVGVLVWAFSVGLGLAAFGWTLSGITPAAMALTLLASLVFSLVPMSIGFLLGQLGAGESIANAVGNVLGLVMSFLGGAWISLDLLSPEVQAASMFVPTSWFNDAVHRALHLESLTPDALAPLMADMGIVLLFAVACFAVALAVGKLRTRTAEAGGNAAAARS